VSGVISQVREVQTGVMNEESKEERAVMEKRHSEVSVKSNICERHSPFSNHS
jgi:hypothetical protein